MHSNLIKLLWKEIFLEELLRKSFLIKAFFSEITFDLSYDCTYDFIKERKYLNFGGIIRLAKKFNMLIR